MKKWLGTIRVLPAAPETETAVAAEVVSDAELAAHYALACKGNKVRAGCIVQNGRRVQYHRAKLLASIERNAR